MKKKPTTVGAATTTPKRISDPILRLCKKVDPASSPVYIPCQPWSEARPNHCFLNIPPYIALHGGKAVHGWTIWEWPGVWAEAEFHAVVWDGQRMVDITPHDGEEEILFLPDMQGKVFTGQNEPNQMEPLTDNPLILEFLRESEEMNRIRSQIFNERRQPRPAEIIFFQRVAALQMRVYEQEGIDVTAVLAGALGVPVGRGSSGATMRVGRNAPCPCGSGKKFKHCCIGRN
jgi:hypothetical protein